MLCPSTWSRPSETPNRWAQYDQKRFSSSSNNDWPRIFVILIQSSLLTPNFRRRSCHMLADADLCPASNDSCSTVHCASLTTTLWVSATYLSPVSDTLLNSRIYIICSFPLTANPSGLVHVSVSGSECEAALKFFIIARGQLLGLSHRPVRGISALENTSVVS